VYAVAVRGPVTPSTIDPAVRAAATPSATAAAAVPGIAPLAAAPEPVHPRPTVRAAAPVAAIRTLPALDEPRPLTAEDIQPDPLAIPLLRMTPIVTEPIATKSSDDSGRRP
jgi:hypothetical protein